MASDPGTRQQARKRFRDTALASGLVTAEDLDAADRAARGRGAGSGDADALDAAIAEVLVDQGRLTPFQTREILAGRTRFRLGQYTVLDEIGKGGMGQVFKAEHALMGRLVAIKVLPRSKATAESEAAFRREMRILGRLDHENLVRAFDAGYDAMVYYLVTELVPGIDLRRHVRSYGPLDERFAASVISQTARGLSFAHEQRLVHRDVKPGNILVLDDGRVKLLDLGLAGSTLEEEALRLGRVVGTMDYIAPEQIRAADDVGPTADVYALGCTLYYALTGRVPFPGGDRREKMQKHLAQQPTAVRQLAPRVSPEFALVVEAMMAKSPAERIGTAAEVIRRLAPWTPPRPVPLPQRRRSTGPNRTGTAATDAAEETPDLSEPAWGPAPSPPPIDEATASPWAARATEIVLTVIDRCSDPRALVGAAAAAGRVLLTATLAGVGFAAALLLARTIDPERFRSIAGPLTPSGCGWLAFMAVTAARTFAAVGAASRRRA
jgi:serine/threonine protein kinase